MSDYQSQQIPIFKHSEDFLLKIKHLNNKTPHPQKLLFYLLSHDFSSEQCYDITLSQHKKQKLQSEITYLRNKISDIIKSNQNVIALLQLRDEKTVMIQKLLNQRKTIQLKADLDKLKNKYTFKDYLSKGIKNTIVPEKKITVKQNLRFYKLTNKQLTEKIQQLKRQCEKIERHNQILFEQQQLHQNANLLNMKQIQNRTNEAFFQNEQQMNFTMRSTPQSDIWIKKIEQLKQRHLQPQKQCEKLQIYLKAKKIYDSPVKSHIKFNSPQKNDQIYSNIFWYNNLRDCKFSGQGKYFAQPVTSQCQRSINCCKSRQKVNLTSNSSAERSLSRVKSQGSINTTCRSNLYTYRTIYR